MNGSEKLKMGQTTSRLPSEAREFVKFLKNLDEKQQIGLDMTIGGLQLLLEKQKSGSKSR